MYFDVHIIKNVSDLESILVKKVALLSVLSKKDWFG